MTQLEKIYSPEVSAEQRARWAFEADSMRLDERYALWQYTKHLRQSHEFPLIRDWETFHTHFTANYMMLCEDGYNPHHLIKAMRAHAEARWSVKC